MEQAIQLARQFDKLATQIRSIILEIRREGRKRHPDRERLHQLKCEATRVKRDARKVSKQLSPLLRLLSSKPRRVKQSVKQQI